MWTLGIDPIMNTCDDQLCDPTNFSHAQCAQGDVSFHCNSVTCHTFLQECLTQAQGFFEHLDQSSTEEEDDDDEEEEEESEEEEDEDDADERPG
jgi:hypothetical protein